MRIIPFLPARARVRRNRIISATRSVRTLLRPERPPVSIPHSVEALAALNASLAPPPGARSAPRDQAEHADAIEARVEHVERPSNDWIVFSLAPVDAPPLRPSPGQFVTIGATIDGREVWRSYSACSLPGDTGTVTLACKRVEGGLVSNWLNDTLEPGQTLRVRGPHGRFVPPASGEEWPSHVVFVAGGSGITPIRALVEHALAVDADSALTLVFANRSLDQIMFREELAALAADSKGRFEVRHLLEEPPPDWTGYTGRLSPDRLEEIVPIRDGALYYVCGPGPMMELVEAELLARDVVPEAIRIERFVDQNERLSPARGTGAVHRVRFARSGRTLDVPDDVTLLEAGREAGLPLAFSCTMGGCASCKIRLISGQVEMQEPNCLTGREREAGDRLACVARPRSDVVVDA